MPSFKPTQSAYTWEQKKKNIKYKNLNNKKNKKKKQKTKTKKSIRKKCNLRHTYVCHVR